MQLGKSSWWLAIISFQILYGLAIFLVTRDIYQRESAPVEPRSAMSGRAKAVVPGSERFTVADAERLVASAPMAEPASTDSLEQITRMADEHFRQGRFDEALVYYGRILKRLPHEVSVYNNLGLTLHYVGRTGEAIEKLEQGIKLGAGDQRIWLTLGFVQTQARNAAAARRALSRAVEIDPETPVAREAKRLIDDLP